jgi:signal transduction histidine kinase
MPLAGHMAIWLDEAGTATWQQARLQTYSPVLGNVKLGYRTGVFWVRLQVQRSASSNSPADWLLEVPPAFLDEVTLWVEPSTRALNAVTTEPRAQQAGATLRPENRPRWHRNSVFPVNLPDHQPYTLWLRVNTDNSKTISPVLWQPQALEKSTQVDNLVAGLFYGILIFTTVAALVLGLIAGNRLFLWCASYFFLIGFNLFVADGWLGLLLLSGAPQISDALSSICLALTVPMFSTVFLRLLRADQHAPRLARGYLRLARGFSLFAVVLLLAGAFARVTPLLNYAAMTQLLLIMALALWILPREPQTKWVMLSIIPIMGPVLLRLARNVGLAPDIDWLDISLLAGLTWHALILFAIVTYQVSQIYKSTLQAQSQALSSAAQLDEQRHFVALLSHEFRNPLATLDGALTNLLRQPLDAAITTRIGRMARAVARLKYVLGYCLADERLATLAISEHPRHLLTPAAIVQESLQQLDNDSGRLQLLPADAASQAALDRAQVLGDLPLLGAALKNLLDNALKYDARGPVQLSLAVQNGQLMVTVRDHGPGLDAQASRHLFEKFARGQQQQHLAGAGLGLYLSRKIAQQHGGDIHIHNAPDGGAVAELRLPLVVTA